MYFINFFEKKYFFIVCRYHKIYLLVNKVLFFTNFFLSSDLYFYIAFTKVHILLKFFQQMEFDFENCTILLSVFTKQLVQTKNSSKFSLMSIKLTSSNLF